jgi:hypothetical protein
MCLVHQLLDQREIDFPSQKWLFLPFQVTQINDDRGQFNPEAQCSSHRVKVQLRNEVTFNIWIAINKDFFKNKLIKLFLLSLIPTDKISLADYITFNNETVTIMRINILHYTVIVLIKIEWFIVSYVFML